MERVSVSARFWRYQFSNEIFFNFLYFRFTHCITAKFRWDIRMNIKWCKITELRRRVEPSSYIFGETVSFAIFLQQGKLQMLKKQIVRYGTAKYQSQKAHNQLELNRGHEQMAWFRFINDSLYSKAKQQTYVYSKFSLINIHSALFSVCRINITQKLFRTNFLHYQIYKMILLSNSLKWQSCKVIGLQEVRPFI